MNQDTKKCHLDTITFSVFCLLLGVGFATLLSASYLKGGVSASGDHYFFFHKQAGKLILGAVLMFIIYKLPTSLWMDLWYLVVGLSVLLLIMSFVPIFQITAMGASRWIRVGPVTLQPSEVARIGVVVYMAHSLSRKGELAKEFFYGFTPHLLVLIIFGSLIVLQTDLGGAIIIAGIIMALTLVSGLKKIYLFLFGAVVSGICTFLIYSIGYRVNRIRGWLDPEADPLGVGYPILHSFYAFANGGIFGMGPGQGLEKQLYIPEIHTDYIFAVVGEEFGFFGVIFVSGLFLFLVYRGLMIARAATKLPDFYLAVGATMVVGLPAFVNMGVALSLWPAKGLALPFFSYGGTNLVVSMCAVAILLQVARQGSLDFYGSEKTSLKLKLSLNNQKGES
ncbi:MAG: putative lipid II flippase FtsW [Deltaproteobacteria bacterium]|jgi:cell division protein FtsW|nr:putative lipid II flippase FtsW [Deltaproteobacteria bacterium]